MSVPVKHHTHGKVGRRRSHLALKPTAIHACFNCKAPVLPHRVCANCGSFQTHAMRKAAAPKVEHKAKAVKATPQAEAAVEEEKEEVAEATNDEVTEVTPESEEERT